MQRPRRTLGETLQSPLRDPRRALWVRGKLPRRASRRVVPHGCSKDLAVLKILRHTVVSKLITDRDFFLTCFHASFFPFCSLLWPPLFHPFSRCLFALFSPSNSALFCRAKRTAQSLERSRFRVDLSTKFGKEIPSRNLHEKRSVSGGINFQLQIQNRAARRINCHYRDRFVGISAENLSLQIQILSWVPVNCYYRYRFRAQNELIL